MNYSQYGSGLHRGLAKGNRQLPNNLPHNFKLSWQYAAPGQEPPRLYRLRKWLAARRISQDRETTVLISYLAMDAVRQRTRTCCSPLLQRIPVETIVHEIENLLTPGT